LVIFTPGEVHMPAKAVDRPETIKKVIVKVRMA